MAWPLSFGLLMCMMPVCFFLNSFADCIAPWGGHGVFPSIYRDMRKPKGFGKALNVTYVFTVRVFSNLGGTSADSLQLLMDTSMAIAGVLMFGDGVREEVTTNLILNSTYPKALSVCVAVFIAIIPLTKAPLK